MIAEFVGGPVHGRVEELADAPLELWADGLLCFGAPQWSERLERPRLEPSEVRYVRVASPRAGRAVYAFDGELDEHERALVHDELREDALAALKRFGCDCSPRLVLTAGRLGGWEAWTSEHSDRCGASLRVKGAVG